MRAVGSLHCACWVARVYQPRIRIEVGLAQVWVGSRPMFRSIGWCGTRRPAGVAVRPSFGVGCERQARCGKSLVDATTVVDQLFFNLAVNRKNQRKAQLRTECVSKIPSRPEGQLERS